MDKFSHSPILLGAVLCLFSLILGCGADLSETASDSEPVEENLEVLQEQGPALEEAKPESGSGFQTNFASLEEFPNLGYAVSENLPTGSHESIPLIGTNQLEQGDGKPPLYYWAARVPATYEISLPPKAVLEQIEIQTTGGTTAFEECVVFVRNGDEEWKRPTHLSLVKKFAGYDDDGDRTRYVFQFDETPASAVLFGFSAGCERTPENVYINDIDLLGHLAE